MKPTPRTILIAGNQGGGQRKSTTIATLADSLQTIGYSTKTIAISFEEIPTLKRLCPDTVCLSVNNAVNNSGASAAMKAAHDSPADIAIIDSPSGFADQLANPEFLIPPADGGSRIVVGIVINPECENSLIGGIEFAKALVPLASDFIILAVSDGWEKSTNYLVETEQGQHLTKLAHGRVIEFPAYSQLMRRDHNARPATPSVHIANAENEFIAAPWRRYQSDTLKSITPHVEWLVV